MLNGLTKPIFIIVKEVSKVIFLLQDHVPAATSPLSSPSDYSPCQAPTISESSQSAHRFLQAVFHKKGESAVPFDLINFVTPLCLVPLNNPYQDIISCK